MPPLLAEVAKSLSETKVILRNGSLRISVPIVRYMSIGNPEWARLVIGQKSRDIDGVVPEGAKCMGAPEKQGQMILLWLQV
ncbi:hypothetical protein FQN53_003240 [Emmonsiellopsis sp. PD_33]|nr:hypothetical protein FQN53_003240 [Emmonsiellopsis sp. PD_33]